MQLVHSQNDHFAAFPISTQAAGRTLSTAGSVPVRFTSSAFSHFYHCTGILPASNSFGAFSNLSFKSFPIPSIFRRLEQYTDMYLTIRCTLFIQSYEYDQYYKYSRLSVGYLQPTETILSSNIHLSFSKILIYFLNCILLNFSNLKYIYNNFL